MGVSYRDYCGFYPGYIADADALGIPDLPNDWTNPFRKMSLANLIKAFWSARTATVGGSVSMEGVASAFTGAVSGNYSGYYQWPQPAMFTPAPAARAAPAGSGIAGVGEPGFYVTNGGSSCFVPTSGISYIGNPALNNINHSYIPAFTMYSGYSCAFLGALPGVASIPLYPKLARDSANNTYFHIVATLGRFFSYYDSSEAPTYVADWDADTSQEPVLAGFDCVFGIDGEYITLPMYSFPLLPLEEEEYTLLPYTYTETYSGSMIIEIDDFYP